MFARDEQVAALLRNATQVATTDINHAADILLKARPLMQISEVSFAVETWLRLPLYLQKAGRMAEAERIFDLLDAETEQRVAHGGPQASETTKRRLEKIERRIILEKRELARKRAAKSDL